MNRRVRSGKTRGEFALNCFCLFWFKLLIISAISRTDSTGVCFTLLLIDFVVIVGQQMVNGSSWSFSVRQIMTISFSMYSSKMLDNLEC
jgi:hypothetical protein